MSRAERLLELLQLLRSHRYPVAGAKLAEDLGISLRTLYRDIATLQGQGAEIEGEPGLGYVLRPGFLLPPLMFSEEELETIVLGMRWVAERGDPTLARAARQARGRIAAVLPPDLRRSLDANALLVPPAFGATPHEENAAAPQPAYPAVDLGLLREAIRTERKSIIGYRDGKGSESRERTIWPFALAFFERVRVVVAWCELRQDFRHFRADRIASLCVTDDRYPKRRHRLLQEWRTQQGIPARE